MGPKVGGLGRETEMTTETIVIEPHGVCNIVNEHGAEWAVCDTCGAQWSLNGSALEQVTDGDGYCEEHERRD